MIIKKLCVTAVLFMLILNAFGQDTTYFDNNDVQVKSLSSATYFRIEKPEPADTILKNVRTYYTSGQLRSEGIYTDTMGEHCESDYKMYYPNGKLHQDIVYKAGKFNGHLLTYWENGNPKRIDSFRKGTFIKGECFDSLGRKTAHTVFEKMPEFPGGQFGLMQFLQSEIRYPYKSRKRGIQGEVIIQFIVNKNGSVSNVKIFQSVNSELGKEAERVVKRMPRWTPGMHDGQDVNVSYKLPIRFKLE